ncbi:MAG TPA: hypothetical protein VJ770_25845 [Stellaceae bacterium]|nr:hypothetical protein [Stellaceae bacterium]
MATDISLARTALPLALLVGIGGAGPAAAQQRVGVNGAVNVEATGIPPNAPPRRLVIGQPVIFNEHVTTNRLGQTQILFVDASSMSIGPNSDLVIDQFVYNPSTGTGRMAANLARGIFRYIGGKLSKEPNGVSMTTPAATIGIRGGVLLVDVTPAGRIEVIFEYGGGVTVTGLNGVSQTIIRPGYEVVVAGPGASPSAPFPAPPGTTARLLAALDGRPGANGGATVIPTDVMVVESGLPRTVSANIPVSITAAEANRPPPPTAPPVVTVTTLQNQTEINTVSTQATPPGATLPSTPQSLGTLAGSYVDTRGNGTARGFTAQGTPYNRGTLSNGVFSADIDGFGTLQIPLATGNSRFGPGGTASPLGPVSGTSFMSADGTYFYAALTPVNQPSEREFIYGGRAVAPSFYQPDATTRYFAFQIAPDAALGSAIPFIRNATGGALPNPTTSPLFLATPANVPFTGSGTASTRSLQASLAVNGAGPQQNSVIAVATGNAFTGPDSGQPVLNGQIAGSYRANGASSPVRISSGLLTPRDGNGNSFYGGSSVTGFAVDQNNFSTATVPSLASETAYPSLAPTATYGFTQAAVRQALPSGIGAAPTSAAQSGYFAGTMQQFTGPDTTPGATYAVTGTTAVTTDPANLRVAARFSGQNPFVPDASGVSTVTVEFGGLSGPTRGRQGYIDANHFAALESPTAPSQINNAPLTINGDPLQASHVYMVTSGTVPGAISVCQCQYLQWGYWGGELDTPNTAGNAPMRADVGHINTWLAGTPTSPSDIATLAGTNITGTYNGGMTGAVSNNGAQYLASGNFTATYNFAQRSGSLAINNYDGRSFPAMPFSRVSANGANYSITVPSSTTFTGRINGSFYGPMAQETGGNFALQGPPGSNYLTSGIFAGRR